MPTSKDALGVLNLAAAGITKAGPTALIRGQFATELQAAVAKVPAALALHKKAKDLEKELERLY